jgi:hypothetical protein
MDKKIFTALDTLSLKGLRPAHLRQLTSYIHKRDESGWYYGNRIQFEKRHSDLIKWIYDAVRAAESERDE